MKMEERVEAGRGSPERERGRLPADLRGWGGTYLRYLETCRLAGCRPYGYGQRNWPTVNVRLAARDRLSQPGP